MPASASKIATASRLIKAGALLPAGTPCAPDLPVDYLDARRYRSPVLTHPVVSLVAPAVAPGEDLVMEFLGFGPPEIIPKVGQALHRAAGFPGWALINDPAHARHALGVVKQMKTVARRIRSKPGHAWDGFVSIAGRLGRSTAHFLPSFWEESGRMYLAASNLTYASRCFGKAREAEKTHALAVDLQTLRDSFLEFALQGAVTVKALGEFARQLTAGHSPAVAWEALRDLAVRRCQGGLPPWATMLTELRALAAVTKLDREAEMSRLIAELLPLSAVRRAPASFWEAASASLAKLAADPFWQPVLLNLLPTPPEKGTAFAFWWVEKLDTWGLVRHLEAGKWPDGTALDVAAWVERIEQHTDHRWRQQPAPDLWLTMFERLAPVLTRGRPVQLVGNQSGNADLDLVHLALELGVPLADPPEGNGSPGSPSSPGSPGSPSSPSSPRVGFSLRPWAQFPEPTARAHPRRRRDPARVHADPRFTRALEEAAVEALGDEHFDGLLPCMPTLLAAATAWANGELDKAENEALPTLGDVLTPLTIHLRPAFLRLVPEIARRLAGFDAAPCLARTLQIGLIDEFGWPALEQTFKRLGGDRQKAPNTKNKVRVMGEAPFAVVWNALRAEVVGPEGTVLSHDFSLPAGASVDSCWYRDGQLLVGVHKTWQECWWYWSSNPREQIPHSRYVSQDFAGAQVNLPNGGTSTGFAAVHAGDRDPDIKQRALAGDGRTWWTLTNSGTTGGELMREIDLTTGDLGRASLPGWFEEAVAPGRTLDFRHSHLLPLGAHVDGSCLGGRDGITGVRVWRTEGGEQTVIESIDGRQLTVAKSDLPVTAIVRWPEGGNRLFTGDSGRSYFTDGSGCRHYGIEVWSTEGIKGSGYALAAGQTCPLPLLCWHAMQPRDPAASKKLRSVDTELARLLLDQALEELPEVHIERNASGHREIFRSMPASNRLLKNRLSVTNERLRSAMLRTLVHTAQVAERLRALAGDAGEDDYVDEFESLVVQGCQIAGFAIGYESTRVAEALAMQGAYLRSADAPPPHLLVEWWAGLSQLAQNCCLLLLSEDHHKRSALAAVLRIWADAGLADLPGSWRVGAAFWDEDAPPIPLHKANFVHQVGCAREAGNVFLVQQSPSAGLIFEYAPGSRFAGLAKAPFTELSLARPLDWSMSFLRKLIAALEDGAPPILDRALLDRAAAASGASRAEMALLLLDLSNLDTSQTSFLPKALREKLGLKVAETSAAQQRLSELSVEKREALARALMGDDPAEITAMETPGADGTSPLSRLAAAWKTIARNSLDLDPGEQARRMIGAPALRNLNAVLAQTAEGGPLLPPDLGSLRLETSYDSGWPVVVLGAKGKTVPPALNLDLLGHVCDLAAGLQLHQPAGLAGTAVLTRLVSQLRERLADPRLLLPHGNPARPQYDEMWPVFERAWKNTRGATETTLKGDGHSATVRDCGWLVLVRAPVSFHAFFRPALTDGPAAFATLEQLIDVERNPTLRALRRWTSPATQRLFDRLANPSVPAGAFMADPRVSVPKIVKAAMARLRLTGDSAVAYLQYLALTSPNVTAQQRWNQWDNKRLTAALDPLLAAGLLLKAKRAQSGRDYFLPGGWETDSRLSMPIDTWKLGLYGIGRDKKGKLTEIRPTVPYEPLDALFERAWKRIEAGDCPRYEAVK